LETELIFNSLLFLCNQSRDIAKLRLRETKIKSELEASKISAEKALRDNKLKSLELKAAVLRLGKLAESASNLTDPLILTGYIRRIFWKQQF
jgi:hypothetical protein